MPYDLRRGGSLHPTVAYPRVRLSVIALGRAACMLLQQSLMGRRWGQPPCLTSCLQPPPACQPLAFWRCPPAPHIGDRYTLNSEGPADERAPDDEGTTTSVQWVLPAGRRQPVVSSAAIPLIVTGVDRDMRSLSCCKTARHRYQLNFKECGRIWFTMVT